ncbi:MAG TPA: hypothetical protein VMR62_09510 [Bryobacteraceae bacterium]|jgi:hypothetical protein|nr:hypothetical protein [Bryobacteraceae bacterium]
MDALLWILLPGFAAVGSGLLAFYIMQSRMEVALAREREAMAQARGTLEAEKNSLEQALTGARESARREALDNFLADVHVEQRHYVRDNKALFQNRKALVLQERIFFRNIPLSNWIEHEIVLQEGEDADKAARSLTSFVDVVNIEPQFSHGNRLIR